MNDPWANRHPEWAQEEAATIRRKERASLRLQLGLVFLGAIAVLMAVIAFRDRLPEGW